jgi:ADP-ribose pyrophosphatase YjhB (NUDIX family)
MEDEKFKVVCYACIVRKEEILLVRQNEGYWKDLWTIPGGTLKTGETLEDCVRREAFEETGCQVQILQQTGAYLSYDPETHFEKQVVLIGYLSRYISGELRPVGDVKEIRWVSFQEVSPLREVGKIPDIVARMIYDARISAKDWWLD